MSENPQADYWFNEFRFSDSIMAEIKSILLRINVWEGDTQYKDSIKEIYSLVERHLKAQAIRHEDHAAKLISEAKIRNEQK